MLTIREAQSAVLREKAIRSFEEDLARHLIKHFPSPSAALGGEAEMHDFVRRAIDRAGGYGIRTPGSVTVYAELTLQFGEKFERNPQRAWIVKMLSNSDLPGEIRIEAIRERIEEQTGGRVLVVF